MPLKPMLFPVRSSAIKNVGYDQGSLWVEFQKSGLYEYTGVPEAIYQEFVRSGSKGVFFDRHIRRQYPTRKIH